ncbi:MAG: hypothetical protein ABI720_10825 [Actinomycetes bacterium]
MTTRAWTLRGATALVAAGALGGVVMPAAQAGFNVPGPGTMTLISTPNSIIGGGRTVQTDQLGLYFDQDLDAQAPYPWYLNVSTQPQHLGLQQPYGIEWWMHLDQAAWSAGDVVAIDANTEDFHLATSGWSAYVSAEAACPELTGEVAVDELQRDETGKPTVIALSFRLDCGVGDTTWGTFALNTDEPAMPDEALVVAEADRAIKRPAGEPGGLLAAVPESEGQVTFGWRRKYGFTCADLSVVDARQGTTEHAYRGIDDDYTAVQLDPRRPYEADLMLWQGNTFCSNATPETAVRDSLSLNPVEVTLDDGISVPSGQSAMVRGDVEFPFTTADVESGAAANVRVEIWSHFGGDDIRLDTTHSDSRGRFRTDVTLDRHSQIWAVVQPGRAGWDNSLLHFGAESKSVEVSVTHVVRAWLDDPTVEVGSTVDVMANLRPADETTPLQLERKSRDGVWRRVDTGVSESGAPTVLTLANARRGWQLLRVVAPNDSWHQRGVSQRLRVYGY